MPVKGKEYEFIINKHFDIICSIFFLYNILKILTRACHSDCLVVYTLFNLLLNRCICTGLKREVKSSPVIINHDLFLWLLIVPPLFYCLICLFFKEHILVCNTAAVGVFQWTHQ